jgi:uncharacterized protein (DUF2235 family)
VAKNIVLFSDGTGNSSASPFKTNIWRLYQAIDIEPPKNPEDPKTPEQLVYYDNGVGTENFKPLAALGGALGFGVWNNVKDLYTFVCRNYALGDQIYGFGFSRGAFTIRLLMGLIGNCGIVKTNPHSEAKLREAVEMAYEAYRRDFLLRAARRRWTLSYYRILRKPRYLIDEEGQETKQIDLTNGKDDSIVQFFVDVPFLGVWDTVDAYGMPVDELKIAIDRCVWPMSFADRDPARNITAIRHALSLDDERPTFRPVLWNEVVPDPAQPGSTLRVTLGRDRIQQVWFAGVHADVGGGYPDDGLAYSALDWMMSEASACNLRFIQHCRDEVRWRASPHGEQYDSRAGVAGYYRYGPRDVSLLCDDERHGVKVPIPWVHVDAFDRIARHQRAYAPVSLDKRFQLTGGNNTQYPPPEFLSAELDRLENAWDIVWWRRIAYFATVLATGFVVLFFVALIMDWPKFILAKVEHVLSSIVGAQIDALAHWTFEKGASSIAFALPGWLTAVLPSFSHYPVTAILALVVLAVLFFWVSRALQARIGKFAEWGWAAQKGLPADGALEPNWMNAIARPGRRISGWVYRNLWLGFVVNVIGIVLGVVAIVVSSPYWIWRVFRRRPWMA